MRKLKGKQIFMEGLLAAGVRKLFGNPGTTEMPLMDSLTDYPEMEYYLALHEGVAVGMADAFALASGTPGVVNLHVAPGPAARRCWSPRGSRTPVCACTIRCWPTTWWPWRRPWSS